MYINGFSLWADFIERDYLDGDFKTLINDGIINGATSNPAIFKNAILSSPAYKEQIASLKGKDAKAIYEEVAMYDIKKAAGVLKPLYDANNDGFVSIEVDPFYCDDAQATIEEGKRLFKAIACENVMIKVPATNAGYEAMEALVAEGIHVNATLIFSVEQALSCAKAFARGLEKTSKEKVCTVISVFVSRVDRLLDEKVVSLGLKAGRLGVNNAAKAYVEVEKLGVKNCRVLFASTGVKGDSYIPSYYVDELLATNSVNTAPIATIEAFVKNGVKTMKEPLLDADYEESLKVLADNGVDLDAEFEGLKQAGLEDFKNAFTQILDALK